MKQRHHLEDYVLLAFAMVILAWLIVGCGGSDRPAPAPRLTAQAHAVAGDAKVGSGLLVLPLQGPALVLERPATVRVCVTLRLRAQAHYAANGVAELQLAAPVETGADAQPLLLLQTRPAETQMVYRATLALPEGGSTLSARVTLRASDADNGLVTGALGVAEAWAEWTVEVLP